MPSPEINVAEVQQEQGTRILQPENPEDLQSRRMNRETVRLDKLDEVRDKLGLPKEEREEILNPEIEKELNEATTFDHLFEVIGKGKGLQGSQ